MTNTARWSAAVLAAAALLSSSTASAIDPFSSPAQQRGITVPNSPLFQPQGAAPLTTSPARIDRSRDRYEPVNPLNAAGGAFPSYDPNIPFSETNDPLNALRFQPTYPGYGTGSDLGSLTPVNPSLATSPETAPPSNTPRWRLGVYSKDTETGVRLVQVVPNSAADLFGLEPNDVIISVNGYQVGYVGGQLYDCGFEFERSADQDGWVSLLVQNNRDKSLVILPLQLDSRLSKVGGSIAYRTGAALPANSVATVELQEVVRPGAPVVPIARESITDIRRVPLPFEIEYDPLQIDPRRSYQVSATITSGNRMLYSTVQPYAVLTNGAPKQVAIAVEPVSTAVSDPNHPAFRDQQIEQVVQWFREYLQRDPNQAELWVYQNNLQRGSTLPEVRSEILANDQFFNTVNRDKIQYVERLHELTLGRKPSREELAYWVRQFDQQNGVRRDIARDFLAAVGQYR